MPSAAALNAADLASQRSRVLLNGLLSRLGAKPAAVDLSTGNEAVDALVEEYMKSPSARIFERIASEYEKQARPDIAMAYLAQAVRTHPETVSARIKLAEAYLSTGETVRAETLAKEALAIDQSSARAHALRAKVYAANSRFGDAIASYELAIQMGQDDDATYFALNKLYDMTGTVSGVKGFYQRIGDVLLAEGNIAQARQVYLSVIQRTAVEEEGYAAADKKTRAAMVAAYEQRAGMAYYGLGRADEMQGMYESAYGKYGQALALGTESPELYEHLASSLESAVMGPTAYRIKTVNAEIDKAKQQAQLVKERFDDLVDRGQFDTASVVEGELAKAREHVLSLEERLVGLQKEAREYAESRMAVSAGLQNDYIRNIDGYIAKAAALRAEAGKEKLTPQQQAAREMADQGIRSLTGLIELSDKHSVPMDKLLVSLDTISAEQAVELAALIKLARTSVRSELFGLLTLDHMMRLDGTGVKRMAVAYNVLSSALGQELAGTLDLDSFINASLSSDMLMAKPSAILGILQDAEVVEGMNDEAFRLADGRSLKDMVDVKKAFFRDLEDKEGIAAAAEQPAIRAIGSLKAGLVATGLGIMLASTSLALAAFVLTVGAPVLATLMVSAGVSWIAAVGLVSQAIRVRMGTGDWNTPIITPKELTAEGRADAARMAQAAAFFGQPELLRRSQIMHERIHRAVGEGEALPYLAQAGRFMLDVGTLTVKPLVALVDITLRALNLISRSTDMLKRAIGTDTLDVDLNRITDSTIRSRLMRLMDIRGVDIPLKGTIATAVAITMATGRDASAVVGDAAYAGLYSIDNISVVKTADGRFVVKIPAEAKKAFWRSQLEFAGEKIDVSNMNSLAVLLVEWAKYSAFGFGLTSDTYDRLFTAVNGLSMPDRDELLGLIVRNSGTDRAAAGLAIEFVDAAWGPTTGVTTTLEKAERIEGRMAELATNTVTAPERVAVTPLAMNAMVIPESTRAAIANIAEMTGIPYQSINEDVNLLEGAYKILVDRVKAGEADARAVDQLISTMGNETLTSVQRLTAMMELLDKAGFLQGNIGIVIDLRRGAFDPAAVVSELASIGPESPVKPLLIVESYNNDASGAILNAIEAYAAENGMNSAMLTDFIVPNILFVGDEDDVITKARERFTEMKVIDPRQMSFGLAADNAGRNAGVVLGHVQSNAGQSDQICNFLFADPAEDSEDMAVQKNIPAMNLVNILTRLSQKDRPTVMAIGCEEDVNITGLQDDLGRILGSILNFIRIKAMDFGKTMGELLNAITQVEVSV